MDFLETVYKAPQLEPAWAKIPSEWQEKIAIDLANGEKLTGWDQFLSIFGDYYIAYRDLSIAQKRFLYIFMSNIFILEQIGKHKDQIRCLTNMDNWKDVTTSISVTDTESENKNSAANTTKSNNKSDNLNKLGIKRSDSNSFAPEGDIPPYNQYEDQNNLVASTVADDAQGLSYSMGNTDTRSKGATKTESTNNARDCLDFLRMEIKNLYDKFWKKFAPLFLFNC